MPSVVLKPCEPKPANRTRAYVLPSALLRAPFRLLSTRAPRQAVLRASFWLAPCASNRPCDLRCRPCGQHGENKTRDASDRLLPPERFTCTRTSCVPGSLRDFRRVDTPRSLGLRAALPGDRVFHDTRERFGGSPLDTRCHIASSLAAPSSDRMRKLRAWAFSSHGAS
jgi:hypothetical protein